MHSATTTTIIAAAVLAAAGCGEPAEPAAEPTPTTPMITSFAPVPIAQKVLPDLLLSPEQINAAMAAQDMVVSSTGSQMSDDSATMEPRECLAVDGAAQALVYADSGFTDVSEMTLRDPEGTAHYAHQAVVRFAEAEQATAFYTASAQQWPACTHYTHTQSGTLWEAAPISDTDGVLSTIGTQTNAQAGGWACGRALTVNNNVVVDVNTCSANPGDSAVRIARQIATRVDDPPRRP